MNIAFQRAISTGDARKFLAANGKNLSPKQRRALQEAIQKSAPKPSANASSRPAVSKAAASRPRKQLAINTMSNKYNELFCAAHAPLSWPLPKPYFFGSGGSHRYRQVRASTGTVAISLPVSKSLTIMFDLYSANAPIRMSGPPTATLAADQSFEFSTAEARKDRTNAAAAAIWTNYATFLDCNPCSFFEDPSAIKNGNIYKIPTSDTHPVSTQCQAASMHVECMTTYGGSAVVHTLSPGDAPGFVGRHGTMVNVAKADTLHPYLHQELRCPFHRITDTPLGYAEKYGVTRTVPGNTRMSVSVCSQPHTGWTFTGTLENADAPEGQVTCSNYGFAPANNILARMTDGYVIVENTSTTDAMTVLVSGKFVYAYVVEPDDGARTLGALASSIARDSIALTRHLPDNDVRATAMPSAAGTLEQVRKSIGNAIHSATGAVEAAENAAKSFGAKHSTALEVAGGAVAYQTGLFGKVAGFARNLFGGAENAVGAAARYVAPTVEEVFEGAEAVGGAVEGALPLMIAAA